MRSSKDLSFKVDPTDRKTLLKIADTAITGKSIEPVKGKLDGIIVDAVMTVAEKVNGKIIVDEEDVMIKKQKGAVNGRCRTDPRHRHR